jgi:hypothetical protein
LGAFVATAAGAAVIAVSPGNPRGALVAPSACPTFSWGAPPAGRALELDVYALSTDGSPSTEPVLRQSLPSGATAWTPSADRCFAPGRYAWLIRVAGDAEGDASEPMLFTVERDPAERWKRLLAELEARSAAPETSSSGAGKPESQARPAVSARPQRVRRVAAPVFTPCSAGAVTLQDVDATSPFCAWILQLYADQITAGCSTDHFCPENPVTRQQLAVLLEKGLNGGHQHFGEIWTGAATHGLRVENSQSAGFGLFGYAPGTGLTRGVYGQVDSASGVGVEGFSVNGTGVWGHATNQIGVLGQSVSQVGVYGSSTDNAGVRGYSVDGPAMSGVSGGSGLAGEFVGNVSISGDLLVGGIGVTSAGQTPPEPVVNTTLEAVGGTAADIWTGAAIGIDGFGLIAYRTSNGGDLRVVHCENTDCTVSTITSIDSASDVGRFAKLTIGPDGLGLISYRDSGSADLKVAHCSNVGCTSASTHALDTTGDTGYHTAIAIGADGLGIISYNGVGGLKVAHCVDADCASADISPVLDPVGGSTSIAIGSDGLALISYVNGAAGDL